jgi:uncharacterized phage protein (TIGR02220 family)
MDWSNEEYVRVYTRETPDDIDLSWEALAMWGRLLTKFDRSGRLPVRNGWASVARLIRWPADVVERVGPELVRDGRVRMIEAGLFAPNFVDAQTASKSDKHRQRESRDRRRAEAESMKDVDNQQSGQGPVTDSHGQSRDVTTPSREVTLCSALLCDPTAEAKRGEATIAPAPPACDLALVAHPTPEPKRPRPKKPVLCTDAERASVELVLAKLSEQSGVAWEFCDTHAKLILARLREGVSEWDLRIVIGYCAAAKAQGGKGWKDDEKMAEYLRPKTLFGASNIAEYLPQARAWFAKYVDTRKEAS